MGERDAKIRTEAIPESWLWDGMTVAIGDPAPMVLIRQIISSNISNLTIIGTGYALDILIPCPAKITGLLDS